MKSGQRYGACDFVSQVKDNYVSKLCQKTDHIIGTPCFFICHNCMALSDSLTISYLN